MIRLQRSVSLLLLSSCAVLPPAGEPQPCLGIGPAPPATGEMISTAVAILEAAGHRAADYRLELRMEAEGRPDSPGLGDARVRSVVFVPRRAGAGYAVRVHPSHPCELMWVWEPQGFTPRQREALRVARDLIGSSDLYPDDGLTEIRVLETEDTIEVRLSRGTSEVRERRARIDKRELPAR